MATLWQRLTGRTTQTAVQATDTRGLHEYMVFMTGAGLSNGKDIKVTPITAFTIGVLFECAEAITNTFKLINPKVIEERKDGGKYVASDHPVHRLINLEPNTLYDASKYYETLIIHYLFWGNAYAVINRSSTGRITSLEIIEPYDVEVEILTIDGVKERWYKIKDRQILNQRDIIHISDISYDMVKGMSRIYAKSGSLKQIGAVENYANDMYRNGAFISGYLYGDRVPGPTELEYMRKKINEKWQATGEIGALPAGYKFEQFKHNVPFADAQVIEATKMSVETAARIMGVTLSLIGRGDSADNKADREYNTFLNTTIAPISILIDNEHNRKLFTPQEKGIKYIKFELKGLYRVDMLVRYQAHQIALNQGFMNKDEVRAVENMNPIPDGYGKTFYQMLNTIPLNKAEEYFDKMIEDKAAGISVNENTNDSTGT
jgi:HK97 family phage portal protein